MLATTVARKLADRNVSRLGLFLLVALGCVACTVVTYSQDPAYYQRGEYMEPADDFDYLSQYGDWDVVVGFGTVWRPAVVGDWGPFWHGHWIWTNYGWSWVSYEPFGWLVYHYGYWYYEPAFGWFWVPGHTWSPARVSWYTYGDYCAWAPMPPPHHAWPDPWGHHDRFNAWVMVDARHFTDDNVIRHRDMRPVPRESVAQGKYVTRAPDVRHIEAVTRTVVPRVRIDKQPVDVRARTMAPEPRYAPKRTPKLERMVLPQQEKGRVEEHTPQVEREVLGPKKAMPQHDKAQDKSKEKKSNSTRKKGAS